MYHKNRLVGLGKVTHGQKTRTPPAKPLGSALLVLHNLKLHGDQQRENMAPFERILAIWTGPATDFFVVALYHYFIRMGIVSMPNVIWIDSFIQQNLSLIYLQVSKEEIVVVVWI